MKLALASLISSLVCGSVISLKNEEIPSLVSSTSTFGQKILSQARRLDASAATEFTDTWIAGYSLVFQGCHHISQWNDNVEGEDDVRIVTKRLIRFRLCATDSCSSSTGCNSNYGDYIVDMNSYLQAWFEGKQDYQAFKCEYLDTYVCQCNNDNGEDNFDQAKCRWDCYKQHNMDGICMTENPYGTDDAASAAATLDLATYMQCTSYSTNDGNEYYIGPYCASQGGAVFMGMFSDDSCSNFADSTGGRQTYLEITGSDLPYGNANVIDMDCLSCKEPDINNIDGNDADDADNVSQVCEALYFEAGKCEQAVTSGVVSSPNNNACNYMEGIKIVRKDGTVVTADAKANKTASVFIGVFVVSFILLSAYSFYLKTKLDRASINLAE